MAANTIPIYAKIGRINWSGGPVSAVNIAKDGTGTVTTVFSADPTNGSFLQKITIRALGTNVATVLRVFLNNGLTNATPANNVLFSELGLVASTLSEIAAQSNYEIPMNIIMPPGYKINITLGTAVAAGYHVTCLGGDY